MVHIFYFENLICLEIYKEITDHDLGNYLEVIEKRIDENKKFGILFNLMSNKTIKNEEVTKIEAIWINRNKKKLEINCTGIAMVSNFDKPIIDNINQNYLNYNYQFFKKTDEALKWFKEINR